MPIILQCNVSENAVYICATQRMHCCFCITLLIFAVYCFTTTLLMLQPVLGCVKMEEHAMKQPVHVTVQMATVGTPVEVSAPCDT